MLTSVVLILAGITAWCVASLALALVVGPMVRRADRADRNERAVRTGLRLPAAPVTGAIRLPLTR